MIKLGWDQDADQSVPNGVVSTAHADVGSYDQFTGQLWFNAAVEGDPYDGHIQLYYIWEPVNTALPGHAQFQPEIYRDNTPGIQAWRLNFEQRWGSGDQYAYEGVLRIRVVDDGVATANELVMVLTPTPGDTPETWPTNWTMYYGAWAYFAQDLAIPHTIGWSTGFVEGVGYSNILLTDGPFVSEFAGASADFYDFYSGGETPIMGGFVGAPFLSGGPTTYEFTHTWTPVIPGQPSPVAGFSPTGVKTMNVNMADGMFRLFLMTKSEYDNAYGFYPQGEIRIGYTEDGEPGISYSRFVIGANTNNGEDPWQYYAPCAWATVVTGSPGTPPFIPFWEQYALVEEF